MQERIKLKPVELKRAAVLLSLCLYAPMTRWSFAVFGCRQLRQFEQEARLNVDLGAVCWDGLHYVAAVTAIIVLLGFGIGLPVFYVWNLRRQRHEFWDANMVIEDPYSALYAHIYNVDYTRRKDLFRKKTEVEKAQDKENEKFTEREVDGPWWWFVVELCKKLIINLLYLGGRGEEEPYRWRFGILGCIFMTGALTEMVRPYRRDTETKLSAIVHVVLAWAIVREILADTLENRRLAASGIGAALPGGSLVLLVVGMGGLIASVMGCIILNARESTAKIKAHADGVKRHWGKAAGAKYVVKAMGSSRSALSAVNKLEDAPRSKPDASQALALFGAKGAEGKGSSAMVAPAVAKPKPQTQFALRDSSAGVPQAVKLGI